MPLGHINTGHIEQMIIVYTADERYLIGLWGTGKSLKLLLLLL